MRRAATITINTLASISYTGAAIGNLSYGWDDNKNKTSEGITGTMSGYGFNVGSSGYDDEDRLVNWDRDDYALSQSWNLTAVGDWNSFTENSSTQSRTHSLAHELATVASQAVQHDAKGNMTLIPAVLRPGSDPLTMTWDFDNRLSAADVDNDSVNDVTYQFDALGRRVRRDDGTDDTVFVQSGQQTIADYPSGTAATSPTYTYVYASYIDEPVLQGRYGRAALLPPQPAIQHHCPDGADGRDRGTLRLLGIRDTYRSPMQAEQFAHQVLRITAIHTPVVSTTRHSSCTTTAPACTIRRQEGSAPEIRFRWMTACLYTDTLAIVQRNTSIHQVYENTRHRERFQIS